MNKNSSKKYYAICHTNGKTLILEDWKSCQQEIQGSKGVRYKSFTVLDDALSYIKFLRTDSSSSAKVNDLNVSALGIIDVYVDGSYNQKTQQGSWAWIALNEQKDKVLFEENGLVIGEVISRNIDGELMAATKAMLWAYENKKTINIHYDYLGIEMWAIGRWKANSMIAKQYKKRVQDFAHKYYFLKIEAHSGNQWNDYVDRLAKSLIDL